MVSEEEVAGIGHTLVATDIGGTDATGVIGVTIIAIFGGGKSRSQTEDKSWKRLKEYINNTSIYTWFTQNQKYILYNHYHILRLNSFNQNTALCN